jgi:hypothetical protein
MISSYLNVDNIFELSDKNNQKQGEIKNEQKK